MKCSHLVVIECIFSVECSIFWDGVSHFKGLVSGV